jgi:heparosan-N-sulfate-glucuronate 5-epimerase
MSLARRSDSPEHAGRGYLSLMWLNRARRRPGPDSFWHERPELNERAFEGGIDYFMRFAGKAHYRGPFDTDGIPLLDYGGSIGTQYNPLAVAQFGLARLNAWTSGGAAADRSAWIAAADWLVANMRINHHGVHVWMHDFDWPYREGLKAPWYSGLAQGAGLSLLVRAARVTRHENYAAVAHKAFEPLRLDVARGGALVTDAKGDIWIDEFIVNPAIHALNGFIWALWGVRDYAEWSGRADASHLWTRSVGTLMRHLSDFDAGWWSLYEGRHKGKEVLASRYHHTLHITQLRVMHRLTRIASFGRFADRFQTYLDRPANRALALARQAIFQLRDHH